MFYKMIHTVIFYVCRGKYNPCKGFCKTWRVYIPFRYIANNKTVIRTVDVQKHPVADERGGSLPRGLLTTGIYKKSAVRHHERRTAFSGKKMTAYFNSLNGLFYLA